MRFLFCIFLLHTLGLAAQPRQTLAGVLTRPPAAPVSVYTPEPGALLNHTQVMFEYPAVQNAAQYELIIEEAVPGSNTVWVIVKEHTDRSTAALISGLKFDRKYRWRVIAKGMKGNSLSKSPALEFSIIQSRFADTTQQRLRITKQTGNDSGVVSLDFAHTIYSRNGEPLWVVPSVPGKVSDADFVRDLRITPQGTFTFIATQSVYEMNVNGQILWSGPKNHAVTKNSSADYYHSCLIRTPNGNYMTLGNEAVKTRMANGDSVMINYPYITEYNWAGAQTWMWSSRNYFNPDEIIEPPANGSAPYSKAFMSSVCTDKTGQFVYAGFRILGVVLKIERMTGKVVARYTGSFSNQHDVNVLSGDSLLVFNNNGNVQANNGNSSVQLLKAVPGSNELITLWEFDLRRDAGYTRNADKYGNAEMLRNGNLFIGGGSLARLLEVTPDKKVVWEAVPETRNSRTKLFEEFQQTRAHCASSLYPCYFTVREGSRHIATTPPYFFLVNEGTEDDRYSVSFVYQANGATVQTTTPEVIYTLKAGDEMRIILPSETHYNATGLVEVRVNSLTNTAFTRKLLVRTP